MDRIDKFVCSSLALVFIIALAFTVLQYRPSDLTVLQAPREGASVLGPGWTEVCTEYQNIVIPRVSLVKTVVYSYDIDFGSTTHHAAIWGPNNVLIEEYDHMSLGRKYILFLNYTSEFSKRSITWNAQIDKNQEPSEQHMFGDEIASLLLDGYQIVSVETYTIRGNCVKKTLEWRAS